MRTIIIAPPSLHIMQRIQEMPNFQDVEVHPSFDEFWEAYQSQDRVPLKVGEAIVISLIPTEAYIRQFASEQGVHHLDAGIQSLFDWSRKEGVAFRTNNKKLSRATGLQLRYAQTVDAIEKQIPP